MAAGRSNAGVHFLQAMRVFSWVVVPALMLISGPQGATTPRDAQVEALAMEASGAPPEFAADVLIRTSQSPRIVDLAWKRELLETAFIRAYGAQQEYRRSSPPISPDTRQGADALAADTPLNRITLQVRAAEMMRYIDPVRARELFGWIDLNLESGACESPLAPALDEYYVALATLARQTFPGTSQGRSDALQFFELYLWHARLPSEMRAAATAVQRFRPTRDEAAYLETLLREILDNGDRDPRVFSASAIDIVSRISELEDAHRALGISGAHLLAALRRYLVAQLTGPRCSDSTIDGATIEMFNAIVRRRQAALDGVDPIAASDARPSRILGAIKLSPYWETPEARRLHDDSLRLRGTGRVPFSESVRRSAPWLAQADRHLIDVQQWTGTREAAERDYFYQKGILFAGLIDLTPHSQTRTRELRAFADFLHRSDAERRRALWYLFANRLIELTHSTDSVEVLRALEDSGDQILSLYAHAVRALALNRAAN
jgi:hypothetical protein